MTDASETPPLPPPAESSSPSDRSVVAARAARPNPQPGLAFGKDIHHMMAQFRLVGAAVGLGLAGVLVAAAVLVGVRIVSPTTGSLGSVIGVGVIGLLALVGGLTAIELTSRWARKADELEGAARHYKIGCVIAGGVNLVASIATLVMLGGNGVSEGLWMPTILVLSVNVMGLVLAIPRVKHLRSLHYRPILPVTRV